MGVVAAEVADLFVDPPDAPAGPAAAVGAFLAGGEGLLGGSQTAQRPGERRRVRHQLDGAVVVGDGGEHGDADVDTGGPPGSGERLDRDTAVDDSGFPASGAAPDDEFDGLGVTEAAVELDPGDPAGPPGRTGSVGRLGQRPVKTRNLRSLDDRALPADCRHPRKRSPRVVHRAQPVGSAAVSRAATSSAVSVRVATGRRSASCSGVRALAMGATTVG